MAVLSGASQRLGRRMKAAAVMGPQSSWTPCHWILTQTCQRPCGGCLCTSLHTLNNATHRRPPQRESTLPPWIKAYGDQQVATGAGLCSLEVPSHELAHLGDGCQNQSLGSWNEAEELFGSYTHD